MENKVISMHTTTVPAEPTGYTYPSPSGRSASSVVTGKATRSIKVKIKSAGSTKAARKRAH